MSFETVKISILWGLHKSRIKSLAIVLAFVLLATTFSSAGTPMGEMPCCKVGGSGGWSGEDLLSSTGSDSSGNTQPESSGALQSVGTNELKKADLPATAPPNPSNSEKSGGISAKPNATTSDVILNVDVKPQRYIERAIHIDYREFADASNRPRSISELSRILGDAGISRSDSVAIYGEDPATTAYVYLILSLLGQEHVKLLDGDIESWTATGKTTTGVPAVFPKTSYVQAPKSDLIASYDYIKRKDVQVVDARTSNEYKVGSIPGTKNIPSDAVLDGKKIKDESALRDLFAGLRRDKPVVVYSNTGIKASLLWYALEQEGYDSRLYAGDNWAENLQKNNGDDDVSQVKTPLAPTSSPASVIPSGSVGSKPSCH
jgi:3-mercaptopyruvate sulfurtransferase SseA